MKIIVMGSTGVMGGHLINVIEKNAKHSVAAKVSRSSDEYVTLDSFTGEADMVIDFSSHFNTEELMSYCEKRNLPVVVATTGQTPEEKARIAEAAKKIPVFYSGNMSVGVALLVELAKQTAKMFPDADIEIIERHHNRKLDVPSGTAMMIADGIKSVRPEAVYNIGRPNGGKRTKEEIGIFSLRYGNEVGTHEVIVSTGTQTITLKHESEHRSLFAEGAVAAAEFLLGKEAGFYTMKDIMG